MKKLAIALLGLFVATAQAETKYTLVMSGVTWAGCKNDVRSALVKSFKAVDVTIEKGEDRKQTVKFTSEDKTITRGELKKAINNRKYIVWKVRKEKEEDDSNDEPYLNLPDQYEDGTWHLLLLKHHTPYIQA